MLSVAEVGLEVRRAHDVLLVHARFDQPGAVRVLVIDQEPEAPGVTRIARRHLRGFVQGRQCLSGRIGVALSSRNLRPAAVRALACRQGRRRGIYRGLVGVSPGQSVQAIGELLGVTRLHG